MSWFFIVVVVSCGMATREMELGPRDATERGMPEMVRGGDPGVRVTPAISAAVGRRVMAWFARVVTRIFGNAFGRGIGDSVPRARPDGLMEIGVPEMVMAGAPGVRVVPAMETPFGRSCASWPFIVVG